MPSRPVSRQQRQQCRSCGLAEAALAALRRAAGNSISAAAAQSRFSAAQTQRGARQAEARHQPERGGQHTEHGAQGVAGIQRGDAPRRGAAGAPARAPCAGSVAPIAAVAGSSSRKVPTKATVHCHAAQGCAPVSASSAVASRRHQADAAPGPTAPISSFAGRRTSAPGCALRSMRAAERQRAERQAAEEGRHHRQHGRGFVARARARSAASTRSGSPAPAKPEASIRASAARQVRRCARRCGAACGSAAEGDPVAPGVERASEWR